jgi:hypothetical protein
MATRRVVLGGTRVALPKTAGAAQASAGAKPPGRPRVALPKGAVGNAGAEAAPQANAAAGLAEQARANAAAIRKQAEADVALVQARLKRIASDFYDIGLALVRLKEPAAYASLGYASFEVLCKERLKIGKTRAYQLVKIVTTVSRELAEARGVTAAGLLAELAAATLEDDTPQQLAGAKIKVAAGRVVNVETASTRELSAAVSDLRAAAPSGKGKATTAAERQRAHALQGALRSAGLTRARVRAVAYRPGQPADLAISGVPLASAALLGRRLASAGG